MFVQEEKIFAGKVLKIHICTMDGTEWLEEVTEDTTIEKLKEKCLKQVGCGWSLPCCLFFFILSLLSGMFTGWCVFSTPPVSVSLAFIYSCWEVLAIYNLVDWLPLPGYVPARVSLFCSLQQVLKKSYLDSYYVALHSSSISKSLLYFFDFISKHNASVFLVDIDGKNTLIYVCVKIEFHHINLCFPDIFFTLLNVSMW